MVALLVPVDAGNGNEPMTFRLPAGPLRNFGRSTHSRDLCVNARHRFGVRMRGIARPCLAMR